MIWSFFLVLAELVNFQSSGKCIYSQKFGQLDDDSPLIKKFIASIPSIQDYDSGNQPIGKIQFVYSGYDDLLFVACVDKTDDVVITAQAIENAKVAFVQKFFPLIKEGKDDPSLFKPFKAEVDTAFSAITPAAPPSSTQPEPTPAPATAQTKNTTPPSEIKKEMIKIALVGSKYSGKRTILSILLTGSAGADSTVEEMVMKKGSISDKYNALMLTIPNKMIEAGKTQFLSNTDVVVFVTQSVFKDVIATRKMYEIIKPTLPNAKYGVIANKQDASGSVEPDAIQKVYGLPTIPMVATDRANHVMLKDFIIQLIEG